MGGRMKARDGGGGFLSPYFNRGQASTLTMETKEGRLETIQEKQTPVGQNIILIKRIIIVHGA